LGGVFAVSLQFSAVKIFCKRSSFVSIVIASFPFFAKFHVQLKEKKCSENHNRKKSTEYC
ncbi:hypothetical protein NRH13_003422, partial [Proteus mirabilis]